MQLFTIHNLFPLDQQNGYKTLVHLENDNVIIDFKYLDEHIQNSLSDFTKKLQSLTIKNSFW